jgi:hypothetical protein
VAGFFKTQLRVKRRNLAQLGVIAQSIMRLIQNLTISWEMNFFVKNTC